MRGEKTHSAGVTVRRWAYRRGQSAVLVALAALVVAACAAGPLYERAVEQATVRTTLGAATTTSRGVQLTTESFLEAGEVAPKGRAATLFARPVSGAELDTTAVVGGRGSYLSTLVYRDDECRHLRLTSGRCPAAADQVLASAVSAAALGLRVGDRVRLTFAKETIDLDVTVSGLYANYTGDADYWFGTRYSAPTPFVDLEAPDGVASHPGVNAFFAGTGAVPRLADQIAISTGGGSPARFSVSFALRADRVGVDDLDALRGEVTRLTQPTVADTRSNAITNLGEYLREIDTGRRDARRAVLALAVQLALLAVLCFLVVVLAAADQRRPELALARLRGQGTGATAGVFVREMAGLVGIAAIPGAVIAWALTLLACRLWLGSGVRPEIVPGVVGAVVGAVLVLIAVAAVTALRVSRQPISDLLREVPTPRAARGLGVLEAMVVVAALAGLGASVGNASNSTLATLTPTFLAVLAGLILSRLVVLGARASAAVALPRGQLVTALAAVSMARRPGGRFTTTILCVSTALVIFAGQQWSVAAANRAQRAEATNGAAVTLGLQATDMNAVVAAAHRVDPGGAWAAPVAVTRPPGIDAAAIVAVEPRSFGAVAQWGRASARPDQATLDKISAPRRAAPIEFRATSLQLTVASASITPLVAVPPSDPYSAILRLRLRHADGEVESVAIGTLPRRAATPTTLTASVACSSGCSVRGVEIGRVIPDAIPLEIRFVVSGLRAGAARLGFGSGGDWATTTTPSTVIAIDRKDSMRAGDTAAGVRFDAVDDGNYSSMQYLDTPVALPALLAGPLPAGRDELGYVAATGLDGLTTRVSVAGTLPFVPGVGPSALVVDLDLALTTAQSLDPVTSPAVWLRTDDPQREARLVTALKAGGIAVLARTTTTGLRARYENSAPGWSVRFTVVVAGVAEVLAVGLLVLVLMTSRRTREQDLAALRLTGVARRRLRRATMVELLVFVVVGVAGGTVAGLVGAHLALHRLPIFAAPPLVPLPTIFPVDRVWLAGGIIVSVVVLVGAALGLGLALVRAATPDRYAGSGVT